MNAEVFTKGFEKCRLLTNLLGQNVENLDDYGCPKIQDLVKRQFVDLFPTTLSATNKASLCREESKSVWRMDYAALVNFVRVYCICAYY